MSKVIFKSRLGDDVRRFTLEKGGFLDLVAHVKKIYNLPDGEVVVLKYRDDEGDEVTMTDDQELHDALVVAKASMPSGTTDTLVRILAYRTVPVVAPPIMMGIPDLADSVSQASAPATPAPPQPPAPPMPGAPPGLADLIATLASTAVSTAHGAAATAGAAAQAAQPPLRQAAAATGDAAAAASQAAQEFFQTFMGGRWRHPQGQGGDATQQGPATAPDIPPTVTELLDKLSGVLRQSGLGMYADLLMVPALWPPMMVNLLQDQEFAQNVFVPFVEQLLAHPEWVQGWAHMMAPTMAQPESNTQESDVPCHGPCQSPCHPQGQAEAHGASSEASQGEAVHEGVICDGCNAQPIKGVRFKCAMCPDYDLCETCEEKGVATGGHQVQHPMIKHITPMANHWNWFHGRGGRRRWGGSGRRGGRRGGWGGWGHPQGGIPGAWPGMPHPPPGFPPHGHGPHGPHAPGPHHPWMQWFQNMAANAPASDKTTAGTYAHVPGGWPAGEEARPAPADRYRARFVRDVTIFDGMEMAPGSSFCKIWCLRNTGQASWPEGTQLIFVGGDPLGAQNVGVPRSVPVPAAAPGDEVQVAVDLVAPQQLGRYKTFFRLAAPGTGQALPMGQMAMARDQGLRRFGHRVWVDIIVAAPSDAGDAEPVEFPEEEPSDHGNEGEEDEEEEADPVVELTIPVSGPAAAAAAVTAVAASPDVEVIDAFVTPSALAAESSAAPAPEAMETGQAEDDRKRESDTGKDIDDSPRKRTRSSEPEDVTAVAEAVGTVSLEQDKAAEQEAGPDVAMGESTESTDKQDQWVDVSAPAGTTPDPFTEPTPSPSAPAEEAPVPSGAPTYPALDQTQDGAFPLQMKVLREMGFQDTAQCTALLTKHGGRLEHVLLELLDSSEGQGSEEETQ